MIKILYVHGISRFDTLNFLTKADQYNYFNSIVGTTIDSYYPPHYTNRIRVDVADITFDTMSNYVILHNEVIGDKYYFYFIDDIIYINQHVIELVLTLDTIQTYMFDINFIDSTLIRKSIMRWDSNNNINRNYIRENLSKGYLETTNYENISSPNYYYLITSTEKLYELDRQTTIFGENVALSNKYLYLLPIINLNGGNDYRQIAGCKVTISRTLLGRTDVVASYERVTKYNEILDFLKSDNRISSITVVNSSMIDKILPRTDTNSNWQTYDITFNLDDVPNNTVNYLTFNMNGVRVPLISLLDISQVWTNQKTHVILYTNDRGFSINKLKGKVFSVNYIPQILDENYYSLSYGERMCSTTFPIHKLTKPKVYLATSFDFFSTYRNYKIIDESNLTTDKYLTTTTSNTKQLIETYNDAWITYQSQNLGSLTTGVALARSNNSYNLNKNLFYGSTSMLTSGLQLGLAGLTGSVVGISNSISGGLKSGADIYYANKDYQMQEYNIDKQLQITRENYEFTPDTIKNGNSAANDTLSNAIDVVLVEQWVEDVGAVARKLEHFGYKVNEPLVGTNLFRYCRERYYYNIIQCENINISLDILASATIIENIKARFKSGMRLWENTGYVIGHALKYDNVELKYL